MGGTAILYEKIKEYLTERPLIKGLSRSGNRTSHMNIWGECSRYRKQQMQKV